MTTDYTDDSEVMHVMREQARIVSEANDIAKKRAAIDADKLSRSDHLRIQALNAGLAITARDQIRSAETVIADAQAILTWLKSDDLRH